MNGAWEAGDGRGAWECGEMSQPAAYTPVWNREAWPERWRALSARAEMHLQCYCLYLQGLVDESVNQRETF